MSNALVRYEPRSLTREEQLEHIYAEVASGRALSTVLRDDPDMPPARTFWGWHMRDEEIQQKVARARANGVEAIMEEIKQIADEPVMGQEETVEVAGERRTVKVSRKEMLAHRRLQIETRLKYAQMIQPRKYGVKVDVTSEGEHIGAREPLGEVPRATRIAALMAQIEKRLEGPSE